MAAPGNYSKLCAAIGQVMQSGGFIERVASLGPPLARVLRYAQAFNDRPGDPPGALTQACMHVQQAPGFPCFEGLRHQAFREPGSLAGPAVLERNFSTIRDEYRALQDADLLVYTPKTMVNLWAVYLFHHMGVNLEPLAARCPQTSQIVQNLPRVCLDYPYGDALFSVHASDSHLKPHCSIDNLRVRCHMGIDVPPGCEMRVGTETRSWQEGKTLLFEDSIEHEVWNRGAARRAILIVDFWHPDLTELEIRALQAGFRKAEVRRLFHLDRLRMIPNVPQRYVQYLEAVLPEQDKDPLIGEFWPRQVPQRPPVNFLK